MSIKQTEIGTIHSLENFFLPTESVIVAHPVYYKKKNKEDKPRQNQETVDL
jgi:hypothetical protein